MLVGTDLFRNEDILPRESRIAVEGEGTHMLRCFEMEKTVTVQLRLIEIDIGLRAWREHICYGL